MSMCDCNCIILPARQIELGAHYIRNLLDEESVSREAVVVLVYKFDEKSYCECLKGKSIAKVRLKISFGPRKNIY